jgi:hypothetical protein
LRPPPVACVSKPGVWGGAPGLRYAWFEEM